MENISTDRAPQAVGPYAQAALCKDFVFISGQLGINPLSQVIDDLSWEGQTRQALNNFATIVEAAGSSLHLVVRTEIYLIDLAQFALVNRIYKEFFLGPLYPARQTLQVSRLPLDGLIEISGIASVIRTHAPR